MADDANTSVESTQRRSTAYGRRLGDFWLGGEDRNLHPAERNLLECVKHGRLCKIADDRPSEQTDDILVRAGFLRFLALGGDEDAPVHERGVRLVGAWIVGEETDDGKVLDFEGASLPAPLMLSDCWLDGDLILQNAKARSVHLSGSAIGALNGDGASVSGYISLANHFRAAGTVRLHGATIGGDLICNNGAFEGTDYALSCDGARIDGDVSLGGDFRAAGPVRLLGVTIGGQLTCSSGAFDGTDKALACDGARIDGDVFLGADFRAAGEVRLLGATIGGDLTCSGGAFEGTDNALSCDRARIDGSVFLGADFRAAGTVRLHGATIGSNLDCNGGAFDGTD